ncbi:MAG TPA: hypothetical protein VF700_00835 [Segetibacter sp.]
MRRIIVLLLLINALISCSKKEEALNPPVVIPDIINGAINEINVTPLDITTPDKGSLSISMNNTNYKVDFNATDEAKSNATLFFGSDTILTDESREFASFGKDAVAYRPVGANEITINFKDGRKISGRFDPITSFGGVFGEQLISQWRTSNDPAKPNQKAKDDIRNFVQRYSDKDGPGSGNTPVYLSVTVSKP